MALNLHIPDHWLDYDIVTNGDKPAMEIFDTSTGRTIDQVPLYPGDCDLQHVARVAFAEWLGNRPQAAASEAEPLSIIAVAVMCAILATAYYVLIWALTGSN